MNIVSWSAEDWYWFFQMASVGAALLTFAALAGAVISGKKANEQQSERVLTLEKDLSDAKTKQAEAELAAYELQHRIDDELVSTLKPRSLEALQLNELKTGSLRAFADTVVEVGAIDEILSVRLARQIADLLRSAGWRVTWLEPLKETTNLQIGDGVRIHIADPLVMDTPQMRAATALRQGLTVSHIVTRINPPRPDQPVGTIRIIVGLPDTLYLRWWRPLNRPAE